MNLILFGFKSCGKTYFGKRLAEMMDRPFIDTDDLFSQPPRQLYQQLGEKTFRALEKKSLSSLKTVQRTIIAVGGGTVLDPGNAALLQTLGTLIYLKASPEFLQQRILSGPLPAILNAENPTASLSQLLNQRLSIYESLPAHSVDIEQPESTVLSSLHSIMETYGI